jgi:hypothetical protein
MAVTLPAFTPLEDSLFLTLYARALDSRRPTPSSATPCPTRSSAPPTTTSTSSTSTPTSSSTSPSEPRSWTRWPRRSWPAGAPSRSQVTPTGITSGNPVGERGRRSWVVATAVEATAVEATAATAAAAPAKARWLRGPTGLRRWSATRPRAGPPGIPAQEHPSVTRRPGARDRRDAGQGSDSCRRPAPSSKASIESERDFSANSRPALRQRFTPFGGYGAFSLAAATTLAHTSQT